MLKFLNYNIINAKFPVLSIIIPFLAMLSFGIFWVYSIADAQVHSNIFSGFNSSKEPIQISADKLKFFSNKNYAVFRKNVLVTQAETTMKTQELIIYYESDGKKSEIGGNIHKLETKGSVEVQSANQKITADQGFFDLHASLVKLSGNVILTQGNNIAEGCILTIHLKTNQAQLIPCNEKQQIRVLISPK